MYHISVSQRNCVRFWPNASFGLQIGGQILLWASIKTYKEWGIHLQIVSTTRFPNNSSGYLIDQFPANEVPDKSPFAQTWTHPLHSRKLPTFTVMSFQWAFPKTLFN